MPAKMKCIDCQQVIPLASRKCHICGSYQDWRRYATFGQYSLALIISIFALGGHFIQGGQQVSRWATDYINPTNFVLSIAPVQVSDAGMQFAMTNTSDQVVVVQDVRCFLYLAIDPHEVRMRSFDPEMIQATNLLPDDVIGVFLTTYTPRTPTPINSGATMLIETSLTFVATPRPTVGSKSGSDTSSLCFVTALDAKNDVKAGFLNLRTYEVLALDALHFLERSDYSDAQAAEIFSIIDYVKERRNRNQDSE